MGRYNDTYAIESADYSREVNKEAAKLIKAGSAPYPAMMRAIKTVKKRRFVGNADKSGS